MNQGVRMSRVLRWNRLTVMELSHQELAVHTVVSKAACTVTEWSWFTSHIGSSRNASDLRNEANQGCEQNLKFTAVSFVWTDRVLLS